MIFWQMLRGLDVIVRRRQQLICSLIWLRFSIWIFFREFGGSVFGREGRATGDDDTSFGFTGTPYLMRFHVESMCLFM